jgi:PAS domain S-box-containing protein
MDTLTLLSAYAQQTTENAMLLFDPGGVITWCNETCTRVFGYKSEELIGQSLHRLFTPDDVRQGIPDYELHVAGSSGDMHNDRWMLRADGSTFWATGATTGLRDGNGRLIGFGKILRDSTDVKEQIERLRNQVEEVIGADERKTFFLAKLSHELRNPLAPLSNALQLLNAAQPAQELQYPIKLIERQVQVIRRLVDDLLDVARIRTGKIQLEVQPTDLRDVIARSAESVQPLIHERQQRLKQHVLSSPMVVNADELRLEQAFVNLLTNASKYTSRGGNIEVRASTAAGEAWVRFIDDGIGIAPETLPHVFELFTRGSTACQKAKDGLGIGLAVVKEFVELHGGSVQVRSDGPDKGSEFTVRLPLATAQPQARELKPLSSTVVKYDSSRDTEQNQSRQAL